LLLAQSVADDELTNEEAEVSAAVNKLCISLGKDCC